MVNIRFYYKICIRLKFKIKLYLENKKRYKIIEILISTKIK